MVGNTGRGHSLAFLDTYSSRSSEIEGPAFHEFSDTEYICDKSDTTLDFDISGANLQVEGREMENISRASGIFVSLYKM
jgi:hypothetical protein